MDLNPSPAQQDIADSVAEFLSAEYPISRLRALAGDGGDKPVVDQDTWARWAEMGFFALTTPEDAGGLGLGLVEEMLVFEEFGRHLLPGPLLSTVLATHVAHAAGLGDLTRALLTGTERVGLVVGGLAVDAEPGAPVLRVTREGAGLYQVRAATTVPGIDAFARLSRVELGEELGRVEDELLQPRLWVLAAALLRGIAVATERQSVAYAKVRRQFDRPIGSFQAVKHRCADMTTRAYAAGAQLRLATLKVQHGRSDARFQAASAALLALGAARENAAVNVQNHGGIGFTAEHDAGLFVMRVASLEVLLGDPADRLQAIVEPTETVFE